MATPKQKSRKKQKKPPMPGKAYKSTEIDLTSVLELVENLKELHLWQGAVLDRLVKQARALQKAKKL